ncbi:MAG: efflux RND transporter permease subunit [Vicinamibacteria bacterium]|jgi:HAE1 family hydrophobic/amphiphilic exporter-1|nr:efflux RND transporter permease subunit [Vicinamibacteria bacterium]
MHKLAELCVRRPVFASVLILSLVVIGLFAYMGLPVDRFPNIDFPIVTISTRLIGAAPEEVETEVTDKVEEAVNTISGIDQLQSVSAEGISAVMVMFTLEKNSDVAAQEVRDRISSIMGDLPRGIDPPVVQKIDPGAIPVVSIVLSGPAPLRDLTEFADKTLRRQIEPLYGVGQVKVIGGRKRQVNVRLDSARLDAVGLTAAHVTQALQSQNVQIPGGLVEQGAREASLRTYGRVAKPEDFALIPIATRDGYSIRIGQVATVEDGMADIESVASLNGKPAVILQVLKQSGTNTIKVVRSVRARLSELKGQLPAGWDVTITRDQSEFVLAAVRSVEEHLILGSLLASGIIWLFLRRLRPTIISAVAIPSALIATFGAMQYMGFTLNMVTLLALTLSVGIVIDDAVVVLEVIFRHMEEKGHSARQAAFEGTREIGLAVLAMSVSLIAVFLPIAFMSGIVGRFMNSFGVTMAFAIAVSLLVSFTLTPMMASRWLKKKDVEGEASSRERGFYVPIERGYMRLLRWSLAHRLLVVVILAAVFLTSIPLVRVANKNFLPKDDESQFEVLVRAPEGTSLEATRVLVEDVAARIRTLAGVAATEVTIGDDNQRTRNKGSIYVKLVPPGQRRLDQFEIQDQIRDEVLPLYAAQQIRTEVSEVAVFKAAGSNAELQFWIGGPNLNQLADYSETILAKLRRMPGVVDADTNLILGKPELGVRIDRAKAADMGVRVSDVASTLNIMVGGLKATDFYEHGEKYEVRVRAAEGDRRDAAGIGLAKVPAGLQSTVSLRDVVRLEEGSGPSTINRIARRRQVVRSCNVREGFSSQAIIDSLYNEARSLGMPAAYGYGLQGRSREQMRAFQSFILAFLLSIIFMYLALAAQFESFLHPVTILMALPATIPFALLSIVALNASINIFSMLGILVLFGVVMKNGILQIDHTNGLRKQGVAREEAILSANRDRLRPILMTTLAFVAGMVPLIVSSGTGAATNRAIGTVIFGGQTLALVLTLIGTPVMYSIFDDWSAAWPWWRRKRETDVADND